jgi:hypothetical protein
VVSCFVASETSFIAIAALRGHFPEIKLCEPCSRALVGLEINALVVDERGEARVGLATFHQIRSSVKSIVCCTFTLQQLFGVLHTTVLHERGEELAR